MSGSRQALDPTSQCGAEPGRPEADVCAYLAAIVESSFDAIVGNDLEGIVTSWNAGAEAMFGYSAREMIGGSTTRLIPPDRRDEESLILDRLRRGERAEPLETLRQTRDGRLIDVSITVSPIRDASGRLVGAAKVARDITAQKHTERELSRMSRLYAALSHISQAIVLAPTRDELLRKVCRALVEQGSLQMAWIGWNDDTTHRLLPVASFGDDIGYLQRIEVYTDERALSRGPSGIAFRTGHVHVCNDLLNQPGTAPWRPEFERAGFLSCTALPVRRAGEVCAVLAVYSNRRDFFQDKEVALLAEAAGDLSFALDNFAQNEARRQAEQSARDEVLFSTTMLDSMPGVVYFYDASGRFLRWNRNFETVSGYSAAEISAMHPLDFFAPEGRPEVEAAIAQVFAAGESSMEADFVSRDGRRARYFFTGRRTAFQAKTCLIGVGVDISERQRADARVRQSQARLVEAQRIAGMGSWELDAHTHQITASAQTLAIFGLRQADDQLTGKMFLDFVHPDDRAGVQAARQAALTGSGRLDIQHRIVLRDGSEKVVHQRADVKRDAAGLPLSLAGTVHDITARVRLEAEREARHRAEAADAIKSAFLATMSHELRTPLNSIIGFTGIILNGLAGPLNEEQGKQLGMVRASARHLLALVNDVLDISKIEAGQLTIGRERFDLCRSIGKVVALVEPQVQAKNLVLRVNVAPDLGEAVSDQRRFEQIVLNLLSNAVKFTHEGEIELTAVLDPSAQALHLRVSDSGIGIRPADLSTLFQPFRQLESGLSRTHEGTGLGLAICHRLAALMGGEIAVESEWGKGSTFSVVLPMNRPETE